MNKKTKKLIEKIEAATGGDVMVKGSDGKSLCVTAELYTKAENGECLYGGGDMRNAKLAVSGLAREVARRGRAMAKVRP